MTLYGKDNTVSLISSMIGRDRLPHAFLLFGERGVGKKTLARYIAKTVLCQSGGKVPCQSCISCRKIDKGIHPDFICMTPGGKNGNYLSEELRSIVSDAAVAPNESPKKIYFLPGIDKALPEAQNTLLKVVEEPPEHVMFLMTAESKDRILPTVLSRTISLGITEPSPEDCIKALAEAGHVGKAADRAVSVFGGNIGKCLEYIENGGELEYIETVGKIVDGMLRRDEFAILSALNSLDGKSSRSKIGDALSELKNVLRDVSAKKLGGTLCSANRKGAEALADNLRQSSAAKIYDAVTEAERKINGNGSVPLVMSDLAGKIALNL